MKTGRSEEGPSRPSCPDPEAKLCIGEGIKVCGDCGWSAPEVGGYLTPVIKEYFHVPENSSRSVLQSYRSFSFLEN